MRTKAAARLTGLVRRVEELQLQSHDAISAGIHEIHSYQQVFFA